MVEFLRNDPYGLNFQDLVDKTVNEILYSGSFRHLADGDMRSEPARLWTTDADAIPLEQAWAPQEAEALLSVRVRGTANALALWFSTELAPGVSLSVGPGDSPTHWGMTTAPLTSPVELTPGMAVRTRVRTAPARPVGTWTRWAIALPGRTGRSTTSSQSGRRSRTDHSHEPEVSRHAVAQLSGASADEALVDRPGDGDRGWRYLRRGPLSPAGWAETEVGAVLKMRHASPEFG